MARDVTGGINKMIDFPIIDTHVHLWSPARIPCPWLDSFPSLKREFMPADYDAAIGDIQVESIVFLECEVDHAYAAEEAEWVMSLAGRDKRIKAIIPWAPMEKGGRGREDVEELCRIPLVKGVRRLIQHEKNGFCLDPDFLAGIRLLKDYDLSFDICVSHDQLPDVIQMVRQCPDTVFILDHIAKPDIKGTLREPWKRHIRELAGFENVSCKISGLVTEADHQAWKKEDLKPYIEHVIGAFGFNRVMYGGDWPVVTLAASYREWFSALEWSLSGCSSDELRNLFKKNAEKIYRIPAT